MRIAHMQCKVDTHIDRAREGSVDLSAEINAALRGGRCSKKHVLATQRFVPRSVSVPLRTTLPFSRVPFNFSQRDRTRGRSPSSCAIAGLPGR